MINLKKKLRVYPLEIILPWIHFWVCKSKNYSNFFSWNDKIVWLSRGVLTTSNRNHHVNDRLDKNRVKDIPMIWTYITLNGTQAFCFYVFPAFLERKEQAVNRPMPLPQWWNQPRFSDTQLALLQCSPSRPCYIEWEMNVRKM